MDEMRVRLVGTSPLMMHNTRLANPLDHFTKAIKEITGKPSKKRTDEDIAQLYWLEWQGGLYFDEELGPYIPGENIDGCIRDGAKMSKRGKDVTKAMQTVEYKVPVQYKGPRTAEELYKADGGKFVDVRPVKVQASKSMRCRPIFREWTLEFTVSFDTEIWNKDDLVACICRAGQYVSLGDGRPRYGRFEAHIL